MLSARRYSGWRHVVSVLIIGGTSFGCAAPQYDDQTDKAISTLQSDIDTQFVSLTSLGKKIESLKRRSDPASVKSREDAQTKASFDSQSSAYDKIQVDLT